MDFTRQHNIIDPSDMKLKLTIIGAGSSGSFLAFALAKLGYRAIKVIDFDKVEEHNIPVQIYKTSDIGLSKVDALKQLIQQHTGTNIDREERKVDETFEFETTRENVVLMCLDNMEGRKLIYEKLKDSGVRIIDTRMGGEGFSIHTVDTSSPEQKEKYEKSLEGEFIEAPCGEKAVIYCILSLVAEATNIVKRMEKGELYPLILRREMKSYRFIGGQDGN